LAFLVGFEEVGAHAGAQVLGLADVDDLALGVLVEVAAGEGGDGADAHFGLSRRPPQGGGGFFSIVTIEKQV
jgi:hypothetical protein